jgi:hypothetical protein
MKVEVKALLMHAALQQHASSTPTVQAVQLVVLISKCCSVLLMCMYIYMYE